MFIKNPKIISLGDILPYYITNKRTKFQVKIIYTHWFKFGCNCSKIYYNIVTYFLILY